MFNPAPPPKSALGYHRILAPKAGLRVSPLCLGAMNFGQAWEQGMGKCDKDTAFGMLDYFVENGGNFIDTANNYQNEESEIWLGEWLESRKNRDDMVIATKFTTGFRSYNREKQPTQSNYQGNHTKSLRVSLDASLRKLKTEYIDLLWLHWWDFTTSIEEVMQALNNEIKRGRVLYIGVSDTPAWVVSKANEYARQNGLAQFVVYQGQWSAASRDFERDIIPMCESEGMGLCPWGALGGGSFKTEEQRKSDEGRKMFPASEAQITVSKVLEEVAKRKNTIITSVALAYVMHKTPNVFPIVGGRKIDHLKGNIEALTLELSEQDIEEIENAVPFDVGFPMNFLFMGTKYKTTLTGKDNFLVQANQAIDTHPKQKPLHPHTELKQ